MDGLGTGKAEAYSTETFRCGNCGKEFPAKIVTWVDVTRTPQAKFALLNWQFNIIECPSCGSRHFAGSPFFYEDFEEGLLVAVFPRIPEARGTVEAGILEKYGYYPVVEFFYDMTQIWALVYLLEHYRANRNLRTLSRIGRGEARLRKILAFIKENPRMIELRERLTEVFVNDRSEDELAELIGRLVADLEEMLPWPLDQRCRCGAELSRSFRCCGKPVNLARELPLLSQRYIVYCPDCRESLMGVACEVCGTVYTWNRGTVPTYAPAPRARRKPLASEAP